MCLLCGQILAVRERIGVTPDGLAVHRGACHRRWLQASGFERIRWIDQRRLATRSGSRHAPRGNTV